MISPARVAAYEILSAVEAGRADLSDALAATRTTLRDDRDKALAAEIAIGVQRQRAALDHLIAHFARRPFHRLDREVLEILRLSVYQLLHLTRVPAAAVVDDAVDLTGRAGKRSASGLVNAVLRAISRHRHALPLPPRPEDPADRPRALEYLSRHALTPGMARLTLVRHLRLRRHRGLAAVQQRTGAADASREPLSQYAAGADRAAPKRRRRRPRRPLRARRADRRRRTSPARGGPGCRLVRRAGRGVAARDPACRRGPRALSCSTPAHPLAARRRRWRPACRDAACSSRATSAIGAWICCGGRSPQAARPTSVSLRRTCCSRCLSRRAFDCVFVDAPCSGLGTLRRDPDIKWRRQEDEIRGAGGRPARDAAPRRRCRRARRTSHLRHLFERAGRERIGRGRVPDRRGRLFTVRSGGEHGRAAGGHQPARTSSNLSARPRPRGIFRRGVRPTRRARTR